MRMCEIWLFLECTDREAWIKISEMNDSVEMEVGLNGSGGDLNSSKWLLAEDLVGPALAAFVGLEFLLAVPLNMFIVAHTLYYAHKGMKSSSFLLFMLSLVNLLMALLYLPFWTAAAAAEEWFFGSTDHVRRVLCQIIGFVSVFLSVASIHILAVISIDRFLSIVKPHFHKRYMTWKTSLAIMAALWIIDIIVSCAPFFSPSFGAYGWSRRTGSCLALLVGYRYYTILQALHSLVPLAIIAITSAWTFIFTQGFLKETLSIQKASLNTESFEVQKHIYSGKVLNLIGIFGSLLLLNIISWIPYLLVSVIGFALGFQRISNAGYASTYILFHLTIVSNPLVQTYFRKELVESLKKMFCKCGIGRENYSSASVLSQRRNKSETLRSIKDCQKLKDDVPISNTTSFINNGVEDSMPEQQPVKNTYKEAEANNPVTNSSQENYGGYTKSDEADEEDPSLQHYSA